MTTGDGRPLSVQLKAALLRELDRIELLLRQIADVETERDVFTASGSDGRPSPVALLLRLKAIGPQIGAVLYNEGLYRSFANRRCLELVFDLPENLPHFVLDGAGAGRALLEAFEIGEQLVIDVGDKVIAGQRGIMIE